MTDPVETALRAVEAKYLQQVMEGKALMPLYPREDVTLMVQAALKCDAMAVALRQAADINHVDLEPDEASAILSDMVDAIFKPQE